MRGAIHGIWLTTAGGKLHPQVIPNMSSWIDDAKSEGFVVILWTNTQQVDYAELIRMEGEGIVVADHITCKNNQLYPYFQQFLQQGLKGDKTAFAIASDILRMAIMQETPNDKYFIYVDANDVAFTNLKSDLQNLDQKMLQNTLGFAFKIAPESSADNQTAFSLRSDVLIALKGLNPEFFKDYFAAYQHNLKKTANLYAKPSSPQAALNVARKTSNNIAENFFSLSFAPGNDFAVRAQFGDHKEIVRVVNSQEYLQAEYSGQYGNTWIPEEIELPKYIEVYSLLAVMLICAAAWYFFRNKLRMKK